MSAETFTPAEQVMVDTWLECLVLEDQLDDLLAELDKLWRSSN